MTYLKLLSMSDPIRCFPVYRVHWLKAKARRDRWKEEFQLISSEMDWTVLYYQYQASQWQRRADTERIHHGPVTESASTAADADHVNFSVEDWKSRGKICFAMKQKYIWDSMAEQAKSAFADSKRKAGLVE